MTTPAIPAAPLTLDAQAVIDALGARYTARLAAREQEDVLELAKAQVLLNDMTSALAAERTAHAQTRAQLEEARALLTDLGALNAARAPVRETPADALADERPWVGDPVETHAVD